MRTGPPPFELVVRGGRVVDPGSGIDERADVGIANGRVAAIGSDLSLEPPYTGYPPTFGTRVLDATGSLVVPGLIDLHAHMFAGVSPLAVPADNTARLAGVTTMVSAGDAGAYTIEGFRRLVVERNRTRVFAFLHISRVGIVTWPKGEMVDIDYCDVGQAVRAAEMHRDIVVGFKVRETVKEVGENGLEPLRRAREAAEETGLPVMCHIGNTPTVLTGVLDLLRPGDILTHCFSGSNNTLMDGDSIVAGAAEAIERGVVFDIGHGFGSFDFTVAERAFAAGIKPHTISSDAHSLSVGTAMKDLPLTMSKLLHVGMTVPEVVEAVTSRPAAVIGKSDEIGHLAVGRVADITVLDIEDGEFEAADTYGNTRTLSRRFRVRHTIRAGLPWDGPIPHPARDLSGPPLW